MSITFADGIKLITHPSGETVKQDAAEIQDLLVMTQLQIEELQAQELGYQQDLTAMEISLPP